MSGAGAAGTGRAAPRAFEAKRAALAALAAAPCRRRRRQPGALTSALAVRPLRPRTMNAITMDHQTGKSYSLSDVQCSKTAEPPLATVERRAVEVEVWEEIDWVGLRIKKCVAAGKAT